MHVSKDMLLAELPPYRDEWVMREREQQVGDIIYWTTDAYTRFESDYDLIGPYFMTPTVASTCDKLYDFCIQNLQYVEEKVEWQSIPRPGGMLLRGFCDCKGYAGFIGGCLGAMNRICDAGIDWEFCFASYKPGITDKKDRIPYHVFIIVYTEDGEIWIDPTPGANDMLPTWVINKRIKGSSMPLMENIGSLMENIGRVNEAGELIGATTDPGLDQIIQIGTQVQAEIQKYASQAGLDGTVLGDWMKTGGNPAQIIAQLGKWISGYKYTGGDYALGEIFLNRVLNKETHSRWDTPDAIVPVAWNYFTQLFGIPINVNTDIDGLGHKTLEQYLQGRPEQRGYVTQAQIDRANALVNMFGNIQDKYGQWPPSAFGLLPYAGPIPDARILGQFYTGTLPNGQQVQSGYPYTAATQGGNVQIGDGSAAAAASSVASDVIGGPMMVPILLAAGSLLLWWYYGDD